MGNHRKSPQSIRSTCPGWSRMFVVKLQVYSLVDYLLVSTNHQLKQVDWKHHHFKLLKVIFKTMPQGGHIVNLFEMPLCVFQKTWYHPIVVQWGQLSIHFGEAYPYRAISCLATWTIRVYSNRRTTAKTRRNPMMYTGWENTYRLSYSANWKKQW